MTREAWRQRDPADGDIDWRSVRADGAVIAGLVKLGRSTVVYTYDPRLSALDGARFASAGAAREAIDAAMAGPAPLSSTVATSIAATARAAPAGRRRRRHALLSDDDARFHDG